MAPIATAAPVASISALDATPSACADETQLAVARAEVGTQHLRQDHGEGRAVGHPPARPDGVPERVDQPDARPARLPHASQMRGHQHLRAGLEVRAVRHGPSQPRRRSSG